MSEKEPEPKIDWSFVRALKMDGIEDYKPSLWYKFSEWVKDHCWPFSQHVYVSSFKDYQKKSYLEKTVWGIFYRESLLSRTGVSWAYDFGTKGYKKEDELIETYQKFRWPIQYRLREWTRIRFWPRYISDFWYSQIESRIDPRQAYLTKVIPRTWCDKTHLIPEINFTMVKHFVDKDGEDCFNSTDYEGSSEGHVVFAKGLRECYEYITFSRPILQKQFDNSYPDPDKRTGDYNIDYAENNKLGAMLKECDTKWLVWIVINRDYFWT